MAGYNFAQNIIGLNNSGGGGGGSTKIFIDTSNPIAHGTFTESINYTATEDCYFIMNYICKGGYDTWIKIDNVFVQHFTASQADNMTFTCFLKAGQHVTSSTNSERETTYEVFGLM